MPDPGPLATLQDEDFKSCSFPGDDKAKADLLSKEIDDILSKELQLLSFQDRSKVQEEIHGVTNMCPNETPEMMENTLMAMDQSLERIQHKPIFNQLSPSSYLHTRDWKLRFLRCELHDAHKAAERLVKFTEYIHKEYDMEVLERPLKLSDLQMKTGKRGKEVMECFKSGHSQLLPFRDRSGRRVFVTHYKALSYDADIRYQVFQYLLYVASSDEETQRNGIVVVMWGVGKNMPLPERNDLRKTKDLLDSMPVRIVCLHQCFEQSPFFQFYRVINVHMMTGANNKMRLQTHLGNTCEVRYKLLGYGIPVDLLPFTDSNNLKLKNFNLWIQGRKTIEKIQEEMRNNNCIESVWLVDCPSSEDVVFKAGTSSLHHPGNAVFHDMLRDQESSEGNSQLIVDGIVKTVLEKHGRFLEWDPCGCWKVLNSVTTIRHKIYSSHSYAKKSSSARKRRQNSASSTHLFEQQDGRKCKRAPDGTESPACAKIFRLW